MKIKFESHLDYQDDAVNSICDIFEGEEIFQSNFSVSTPKGSHQIDLFNSESLGIGNSIKIIEEDMLNNIRKIQLRNGVAQSSEASFRKDGMNFSVEMETGTGKTYVYLKTIFELNRRFGFTKFVIVVPSIAIKEGTKKSLSITEEHFKGEFENIVYNYEVYSPPKGNKPSYSQISNFATSDSLQILVMNIDSFIRQGTDDTDGNLIHRYNDQLGCKPIELIKSTHPIVIIDEPQSVDNTPKSQEAINSLKPLCCLRYSATHRTPYNMIYKLDSVDAYELKLVKQIEVATASVEGFSNDAYIDLVKVGNENGIVATVKVDVQKGGKVTRKKVKVKQGQDLFDITHREQYEGYIVEDIWNDGENWRMSFTSNDKVIKQGEASSSLSDELKKREQIRMTIESHLDKELILNPKKIKVLSLFFLDKVSNYRLYGDEGTRSNGKYAEIFEEEYEKLIQKPKYSTLFNELRDKDVKVEDVHDGYFAKDKTSKKSNKKDKFECYIDSTTGKSSKDDEAFNLIMTDKERLLSFDTPLRFIFSHSALREGWDNPNVFQICTLNDSSKEIKKRQEIGRGLRLCVNQDGERVKGFEVNTLTVMANESYEEFAAGLQKEIEEDTGVKFGLLQVHSFSNIAVGEEEGKVLYLNEEKSRMLYDHCVEYGYVKEEVVNRKTKELAAKVQDKLKIDLRDNRVVIPEEFSYIKTPIIKVLKRISGNFMNIKNRDDVRRVKFKKEILLNEDFKELWDRIKYKTTYSVEVDSDKLIDVCAQKIYAEAVVGKGKFVTRKVKLDISAGGVHESEDPNAVKESTRVIDQDVSELPDIVTYLQNETGLTRNTIVQILIKSKRLESFKKNPQAFIESAIDIIRMQMRLLLVDGVKYRKLDNEVWCQELFDNADLQGYLNSNLLESNKSPYDYVIYDSQTEREMAKHFENSENVKLYAKLPSWFKIDTPLGGYNPDWVLVWEENEEQKLYFVVETKGGLFEDAVKLTESKKIECGVKHFEAIDTGMEMKLADTFDRLRDRILGAEV